MKIRSGFVSNSSSSSYLIYGFFLEDLPEEAAEKFEKKRNEDDDLWDISHGEESNIIGDCIIGWEDMETFSEISISPEKIKSTKDKIKQKIKGYIDYDVPDDAFTFIGTTYWN